MASHEVLARVVCRRPTMTEYKPLHGRLMATWRTIASYPKKALVSSTAIERLVLMMVCRASSYASVMQPPTSHGNKSYVPSASWALVRTRTDEEVFSHSGATPCLSPEWYAVRTQSRAERMVRDALTHRAIDSFLPLMTRISMWKGRHKRIEGALFPGYCFAKFSLSQKSL